jgi:hypothetical protein
MRAAVDSKRAGGEQEKSDKSETTKQLTGEYKDFYKTLRKVRELPFAASTMRAALIN